MAQTFRAWDGEAQSDRYVLLMSSARSIYNPEGLSTAVILTALYTDGLEADTVNVLFGMGYDVAMWTRDLDDTTLAKLYAGERVVYGDFELDYIPRKIFRVRRFGTTRWAIFYDVWGYFQCSFVTAVREQLGVIDEQLAAGKANRATFAEWDIERIKAYTAGELSYLEQMCAKLDVMAREVLPLPERVAWYGPGAWANVLLHALGMEKQLYGFRGEHDDKGMVDAFNRAYFGGRIELLQLGGYAGKVYRYDLHSAYPAAAMWLSPCTSRWEHVSDYAGDVWPFGVYRVRWNLPEGERGAPGPFPFRDHDGTITFPRRGEGWYWYPEVRAALRRWGEHNIEIKEGWTHRSTRYTSMRTAIPELYTKRAALKAAGDPREYPLKLVLNSWYGKYAQAVGSMRYACPPWAGYITSQVRAWLLGIPYNLESAIIGYATDAIFSTRKLPLKLGEGLGEWEETVWDGATFIEPGIYQLRKEGVNPLNHTRGYPTIDFDFETLIDTIGAENSADMRLRLFVGPQLALAQPLAYGDKRLTFTEITRKVEPYLQTKRVYHTFRAPGDVFGSRPITDWRNEHVTSHMRAGRYALSAPRTIRAADDSVEAGLNAAVLDAVLL